MTELETPAAPVRTAPSGRGAPGKKTNKKIVKRIIAVVVAAAILSGVIFGVWFLVFRKSDEQGEIYPEFAYIGSIQSTVQGSGNANAKETATITVPANGVVRELLAATGDVVSAGQPLFSIYSEAAQNALEQAQSQMSALSEKLSNLTLRAPFDGKLMDVTQFYAGDMVGEGAVGTLVNDKKA